MGRASVTAVGFALAGGSAVDTAEVAYVAPVPDRFGRVLLACVEPIELSPRGMELAGVALRAIRETFAATAGTSAEALVAAFAAANVAVMAENRPLATGRWERRICVGATAIALAGREIVVAQASPSQAILVQDGQVYAFPDVASWRGDYAPDTSFVESHPLGSSDEQTPRLYHSERRPATLSCSPRRVWGGRWSGRARHCRPLWWGAADWRPRRLGRPPGTPPGRARRRRGVCHRRLGLPAARPLSLTPGLQPGSPAEQSASAPNQLRRADAGLSALVQSDAVVLTTASAEIPSPMLPLSRSDLRFSKVCATGPSTWPSCSRGVASSEQPPMTRAERHSPRPGH